MGYIPDNRPAAKSDGDDYEPATEKETALEAEDEEDDDDSEDDSETPKKKIKMVKQPKPKVRDLIEAQREDLATAIPKAREDILDMEVSAISLEMRVPHISCLIRFAKLSLTRAFIVYRFLIMMPYLILNESTLFYLNLSATKTNEVGKIHTWTAQVAKANQKTKSEVQRSGIATSTTAVSIRTTTSSSAVVTAPTFKPSKKKAKLEPEAVNLTVSAFLEEDESAERDAALSSPIKGKQRLTSKVRRNPA